MGIFLLICFAVMEVALMVSSFTKYKEKKQWLLARWVLRAGGLAVFLSTVTGTGCFTSIR